MIRVVGDRLLLSDTRGNLHVIRGMSLLARAEFKRLWLVFIEMVADQNIRLLYDSDLLFQQLMNKCLTLAGIDPGWVGMRSAVQLLLDTEGIAAQLITFNYPQETPDPEAEEGEPLSPHIDPDAYDIAWLWANSHGLEECLKLASTIPWIELKPILRARAYQIKMADPKRREKRELDKAGEGLGKLLESGKLDQLLSKVGSNGKTNLP